MRLLLVSNRLPVSLDGKPNVGGLATGLSSFLQSWEENQNTYLWIGWPGRSIPEKDQVDLKDRMFHESGTVPVFIKQKLADLFYNGFCNKTIWPLFHYFPSLCEYSDSQFEAYKEVNELFAFKILESYQPGDWIWIHDYHLFLVPALLREKLPEAAISFFLHIPFPTFEVFRLMPERYRTPILHGLLGADVVGFHTQSYTQYFLRSLLRCGGFENERGQIYHKNHLTKAMSFPMGIDVNKFESYQKTDEFKLKVKILKEQKSGKKNILSVDRLDYSKGILQRLNSFELFLKTYPQWIGKCQLTLVLVPSRTEVSSYQSMKRAIDEKIGLINGNFGSLDWTPILYLYKGFPFEDLVPLYSNSDVLLVTPYRDGMNLVAKEFLISENNGVLVLSEMAGAAEELPESILVNPNDIVSVSDAILQALEMDEEEIFKRNKVMKERLSKNSVAHWANRIYEETFSALAENLSFHTKSISPESEVLMPKENQSYFLIFDYDGTLVDFQSLPHLAILENHTKLLMEKLVKTNRVEIAIISGRDKTFLKNQFQNLPIHLVGEHGAWHLAPNAKEWNALFTSAMVWKEEIKKRMDHFSLRVPGSFTEEKQYSLVWHFRNADPDIGLNAAREMLDELSQVSANQGFYVQRGNKIVEVREFGTGKGKAALKIMPQNKPFVYVFGDDTTDEDMFREFNEFGTTVKIGTSETIANYRFKHPTDVKTWMEIFYKKMIGE